MKRIGLIGGTSPESTLLYYEYLIKLSRENLPPNVYPEILIYSVNFERVVEALKKKDYKSIADMFNHVLSLFRKAEVEIAALTANTMHLVFDMLKPEMEMVHIVDSVLKFSLEKGYKRLVLLGTKYTMESDLYPSKLNSWGIEVVIPDEKDREEINEIIFDITAKGVTDENRSRAVRIAERYSSMGDAIILGCTELPLVLKNVGLEVVDTVEVHVRDIFDRAVGT